MDQDFHYYGTYYAARKGGFDRDESTLIAKSSNFIDFFSETAYAAYWELVKKPTQEGRYETIAKLKNPRYTFQQGIFSTGIARKMDYGAPSISPQAITKTLMAHPAEKKFMEKRLQSF
ncbi:Uncharacterised protein [Chromobacterium violaceum]|uniref:Uncharacterized protein n=1 Tax=Chromobacterium violaceum TaxID=536 RepID=A0A447T6T7_CHRVL|nr:Uncharacterised protein [Chromobacterium violaceum]